MSDDSIEKILLANLTRINDWVKFAETKNAALLTFSSAWLLAICSLWSNDKSPMAIRVGTISTVPLIIFAAAYSLISLIPEKQKKNAGDSALQLTTKNLLFHGNISKLDISTARNAMNSRYGTKDGVMVSSNHIDDLITQLVETSRIAEAKFANFNTGAKAVLIAIFVGPAVMMLYGAYLFVCR